MDNNYKLAFHKVKSNFDTAMSLVADGNYRITEQDLKQEILQS